MAENKTKQASRREKTRAEKLAERRAQRTDLGSEKNVLTLPVVEGLTFRYFNDVIKGGKSRIASLIERGWWVSDMSGVEVGDYNVVDRNTSLGTGSRVPVGTDARGEPIYGVLMCIDTETYELDQELKEEEIRATEAGILDRPNEEGNYGEIVIGNR